MQSKRYRRSDHVSYRPTGTLIHCEITSSIPANGAVSGSAPSKSWALKGFLHLTRASALARDLIERGGHDGELLRYLTLTMAFRCPVRLSGRRLPVALPPASRPQASQASALQHSSFDRLKLAATFSFLFAEHFTAFMKDTKLPRSTSLLGGCSTTSPWCSHPKQKTRPSNDNAHAADTCDRQNLLPPKKINNFLCPPALPSQLVFPAIIPETVGRRTAIRVSRVV